MMFRKTPLATAIAAVTAGSLATLPITAQETQESVEDTSGEVEEVVVTGSRIRREVTDTPNPVTILDREELELTGMENVADILRHQTYNSFGSFRERSGTSFGQVALVSLRGLGADRTAVLINGRRVPGNPFTGSAAVDLNSIPLSAIDRVEILSDSASAVYGADALGGVVNIILRDDYEGFEIEIGTEMPTREGADSDHVEFVFGTAGTRSNMLFTAEWWRRHPIFDRDRDYSSVQVNDPGDGTLPDLDVDTVGVSGGGNTAFYANFGRAAAVGDCPTDVYAGLVENPFGISGTACGFGYADISAQTGGLDRISTYLNAGYEWQPDHRIFFENRLTRIASFGRYAPAVGFFAVPGDNPNNPFDINDPSYPRFGDGSPAYFNLFHRFVGHGPRDDDTERYEMDNVLGFTGSVGDGAINYEAYARFYRYQGSEEGETYILASQIELEVEEGAYDLTNPLSQDPDHLAALGRMSATLYRDLLTETTAAGLSIDGPGPDLFAGPLGWAAGVETASSDYMDDYDSFREAVNVLGSAGNSAAGSRGRWAVFGELAIPVLDSVEVTAAGRHDNYDDFGTAFSPQISVRYHPWDPLVVRASLGHGFKAPNLGELYQSSSQSFNGLRDVYRCEALNIDPCPNFQVENYTSGNPDLQAENSESFNIGFVIEPLPGLSVALDSYRVKIEDVVQQLSLAEINLLERTGSPLPPKVRVNRLESTDPGVPGPIRTIDRVFSNVAVREVTGVDLRLHYETDTPWGVVSVDVDATKLDEYLLTASEASDPVDLLDDDLAPDRRATVKARWSRETMTVNYIWRFTGPNGGYSSHHTSDIVGVYLTPWNSEITVGVRNLFDEMPPAHDDGGWNDNVLELYDVAGRVPFIKYRQSF